MQACVWLVVHVGGKATCFCRVGGKPSLLTENLPPRVWHPSNTRLYINARNQGRIEVNQFSGAQLEEPEEATFY